MKKTILLFLIQFFLSCFVAICQDLCSIAFPDAVSALAGDTIITKTCPLEGAHTITVEQIGEFVLTPFVGIGTASPSSDLDVESSGNTVNLELTADDGGGDITSWRLRSNRLVNQFQIIDNVASTSPFVINDSAPSNSIVIDSAGFVGVGSTTPSANLDVINTVGTGIIEIDGTTGGCLKIQDTDGLGFTYCTTLNGTLSCSTTPC